MGFFADMKRSLTDVMSGLTTQVERYKNKNVLEALMAASAYIAAADGHISREEKQKTVGFVRNNPLLSVYDTDEAVAIFTKYANGFEFDFEVGKAEALRVIGKFRDQTEVARMIIRVAIMIGNSDGDFDQDERLAVLDIVREVNQSPADFDLDDLVEAKAAAKSKRADRIVLGGNRSS